MAKHAGMRGARGPHAGPNDGVGAPESAAMAAARNPVIHIDISQGAPIILPAQAHALLRAHRRLHELIVVLACPHGKRRPTLGTVGSPGHEGREDCRLAAEELRHQASMPILGQDQGRMRGSMASQGRMGDVCTLRNA